MTGSLAGVRVLLLEDEAIVNWNTTDMLEQMGCVVSPCLTLEQADQAVADAVPDIAVLDVNIQGRTSFALAARLDGLGVPVVFATAYAQLDEPWRRRPVCCKPCRPEQLRTLVTQAITAARSNRRGPLAPAPAPAAAPAQGCQLP
jgi:DNA-binding NtrC family response regulator